MTATLKLTHKTIGVEVRRGTYDVVLDGKPAGSLKLNDPIEIPVEPGHHTLQVRNSRNTSGTKTFDAAEGETSSFPAWHSPSGANRRGSRVRASSDARRCWFESWAQQPPRVAPEHTVPRRKRDRYGLTSTGLLFANRAHLERSSSRPAADEQRSQASASPPARRAPLVRRRCGGAPKPL